MTSDREDALDQAVDELVAMPGGPPGAIVVVQRGSDRSVHAAGVAEVGSDAAPDVDDHMRVASVSKAFNGAAALSLVGEGVMSLDDTIGERLPDLPAAWGGDQAASAAQPHQQGSRFFGDRRVRPGGHGLAR
jgi:D-alanyl-D-alanine carboxypeptidase